MTTRVRYTATYQYPGSFFPEEFHRELPAPTMEAAISLAPDEEGYFKKDGWYGVEIKTITEQRFLADDGSGDERWVQQEVTRESVIVGDVIHVDDPLIAGERYDILRSNIRGNSREPYKDLAVHTRAGNFQIRSDWDRVVVTA